ncbi:MAG: DUF4091 domain-containing protein [Proteobacteria bacterium]|nr:DUF4091 domain-containing protein [Pseudomonadota bacterium]
MAQRNDAARRQAYVPPLALGRISACAAFRALVGALIAAGGCVPPGGMPRATSRAARTASSDTSAALAPSLTKRTTQGAAPARARARAAAAQGLPPSRGGHSYGVVSATLKVRPHDRPALQPGARLEAGRNEFEPFQIVVIAGDQPLRAVALTHGAALKGPRGHIIDRRHLTFFRVAYYDVQTPSNREGATGRWPDALIPDVDAYTGERRNAFPFEVPAHESRAIWVDVFVPPNTPPGRYRGSLLLRHLGGGPTTAGASDPLALELSVGAFTLPSTATLRTAFGMDFAEPCMAHTGTPSCSVEWNETPACELRARYLTAALDHRFSISDVAFQPPFGSSAGPFQRWLQPLIDGRGPTRLAGARLTAIRLDAEPQRLGPWIALARAQGFLDRLFYFPVDEPDAETQQDWVAFRQAALPLRRFAPRARLALTAALGAARRHGVAELVDIFVPVINYLDPRPGSGDAAHRADYRAWLAAQPGRELWSYQSCMSHGCGECGEPSPELADSGWPTRVIDSSAVQNRAFAWLAFIEGLSGELYFSATEQLSSAWQPEGLCKFSGNGDGTLFYPGTPARIGGRTHIPVASIRAKMLREGIEDHEYLVLLARRDRKQALELARGLFPNAGACAQSWEALEGTRHRLFALLAGSAALGGGARR